MPTARLVCLVLFICVRVNAGFFSDLEIVGAPKDIPVDYIEVVQELGSVLLSLSGAAFGLSGAQALFYASQFRAQPNGITNVAKILAPAAAASSVGFAFFATLTEKGTAPFSEVKHDLVLGLGPGTIVGAMVGIISSAKAFGPARLGRAQAVGLLTFCAGLFVTLATLPGPEH